MGEVIVVVLTILVVAAILFFIDAALEIVAKLECIATSCERLAKSLEKIAADERQEPPPPARPAPYTYLDLK